MKLVNQNQTKEERQLKYKFARLYGLSVKDSRRIRDMTKPMVLVKIAQLGKWNRGEKLKSLFENEQRKTF